MSSRIGICTRYDRHEFSYVATIFADWLDKRGYDVSMYVLPQSRVVQQGSSWDHRHHHGSKVLFSDWCQSRDLIVWTVVPQPAQLKYLHCRSIRNFALYEPAILEQQAFADVYHNVDAVIALNIAVSGSCAISKQLRNTVYLPLVPSAPQYTTHGQLTGRVPTVIWPVFDGDCSRWVWHTLVKCMAPMLEAMHDAFNLKIVVSGANIPSELRREFQIWSRKYRTVTLHTQRSVLWREMQYHGANMMFWPSIVENAMLRGLHAYANGLPIVGIMAEPMRELLMINAHMTVPVARSLCDRHGYVKEEASEIMYAALLSRMLSVVQSPQSLAEAGENVSKFMVARQKAFSVAMLKLFK